MAAHGEKTWPSVGNFSGRPWGGSHGHRHSWPNRGQVSRERRQQLGALERKLDRKRAGLAAD
jgi:hypothetical protein